MLIFPSMNLYQNKVVKVYNAYDNNMAVLSADPFDTVRDFRMQGATHIHIVDIEGARNGKVANVEICRRIKRDTDLFIQVGGGVRNLDGVKRYFDVGVDRVILGTLAVEKEDILKEAVSLYGDKIAVAIDMKDGFVSLKGRTRKTNVKVDEFALKMQDIGVKTLVCTDVGRDGTELGVNRELFEELRNLVKVDIVANGGIGSLEDILVLQDMNMYGALVGEAYYDGSIYLKEAIRLAK